MDYKEMYDDWHQKIEISEPFSEQLNQPWHITVAKLLPDLQDKRVLEIGCGRGDFAIWLGNKYPHSNIEAIDFSAAAISVASQRAFHRQSTVQFQVGDAQKTTFADQSFDYVISCECMEHLQSPLEMAKEIYRILRPGGKFIITTENYFNGMVLAWLKSWIFGTPFDSGAGVQPYENFFVFWQVKKILQSAGLQVEYMESNHFQWLLLPRTDPSKLATKDFNNPVLKKLFRPFGRHFTFCGIRPLSK